MKKRPLKVKIGRAVTLIEMMIVMFLIAMIGGVIAYNYQKSLEEGKAFKTRIGIEKLVSILTLQLAENPDAQIDDWEKMLEESPLVQDVEKIKKDGWGVKYKVNRSKEHGDWEITSERLDAYEASKKKK